LKGLLLKSPGVLSAREFVPPFGLCNPFSHRSVINFMPVEGRVYFVRDPTAVTTIV